MARARLTLLGGFGAHRPDASPVELPTRKTEALLAFLACHAGELQPRDRLMALLWGDRGEQQARHSLSQSLSAIRGALGEAAAAVVAARETVTLSLDIADVDVAELERLRAGDTVETLRAAAELYRGPLLEGLYLREAAFQDWVTGERSRLHGIALGVLMRLADRQAAAGDTADAAASLGRAQTLEPLSEEVHRRLIRLHLEAGAYNSAIRQYRQCTEILKRELGTRPEPATTELYREALNRLAGQPEPTTRTAAEPAAGPQDLAGIAPVELVETPPPPESAPDTKGGASSPTDADRAERRHLTVLSCQLETTAHHCGAIDPEDLHEIVRAYRQCAAAIVGRFGGHIAEQMGMGLIITFGHARACEDDAERAVRTGWRWRRR